jgi:hypothetical protein
MVKASTKSTSRGPLEKIEKSDTARKQERTKITSIAYAFVAIYDHVNQLITQLEGVRQRN